MFSKIIFLCSYSIRYESNSQTFIRQCGGGSPLILVCHLSLFITPYIITVFGRLNPPSDSQVTWKVLDSVINIHNVIWHNRGISCPSPWELSESHINPDWTQLTWSRVRTISFPHQLITINHHGLLNNRTFWTRTIP